MPKVRKTNWDENTNLENKRLMQKMKKIALKPQNLHPRKLKVREGPPPVKLYEGTRKLKSENRMLVKRILTAKPSDAILKSTHDHHFKKTKRISKSICKRNKDHFLMARRYSPKSKTKMYTRTL